MSSSVKTAERARPLKNMRRTLVPGGVVILVVAAAACSVKKPTSIVNEIKAFEETLGVQATKNFLRYSESPRAIYRCYYTGKLELPVSYRALQLIESRENRCVVDEQEYDLFFYPIEAVASGTNPITPALADASLERMLVVVPHEDFHNQVETQASSPEIAEAAATLIGFLAAGEFATERFGATSQIAQRLNREARLFLEKASIVNRSYNKASILYSSFRSGSITRHAALVNKQELFADLLRECAAIAPDPVSFNKCPAAMNNAGLAFDRTYTREYPIMFDLHLRLGSDTKATILNLRRLLASWPTSAGGAADLLNALSGKIAG